MRDIYVMNRTTGEIVPSEQAIREFYKTHGILEAWTDEWEATNMEVENSNIEFPQFAEALIF